MLMPRPSSKLYSIELQYCCDRTISSASVYVTPYILYSPVFLIFFVGDTFHFRQNGDTAFLIYILFHGNPFEDSPRMFKSQDSDCDFWPAFETVIRHRAGRNCTYGNQKLTERQPRVAATIVSVFVIVIGIVPSIFRADGLSGCRVFWFRVSGLRSWRVARAHRIAKYILVSPPISGGWFCPHPLPPIAGVARTVCRIPPMVIFIL